MDLNDPVRSVLERKGTSVISVRPNVSVYNALHEMAMHDIGALLVTEACRAAGIFSERDYARKVILMGRSSKEVTVGEVMSPALCVGPNDSIESCLQLMTSRRMRYLAVTDGGDIVGLVSIGDLVNRMISAQAETIDHLSSYIAIDYPR